MADIPTLFAPATSSLLVGLKTYYKLEDLIDSTGTGLTLTNNNGVTFVAGKVNNAANFVAASNQSLSRTDATAFQPGKGNWSIAVWINTTTAGSANSILNYGKPQGGSFPGYQIRLSSSNVLAQMSDGTNLAFKIHTSTVNDGAWHLVITTFDRAGNISIYVDNGAAQTSALTAVTGSVNDTQSFGLAIGDAPAGDFWQGQIDEIFMASRVWTGAEISAIWNSGAGKTYPFL